VAQGQNRPCPCGSGRKYKLCCGMEDGPGLGDLPRSVVLPPELLEVAKGAEVWQADLVPLPAGIAGEDRTRTVAAMVVADGVVLESDIRLVTAAEPTDVARALEQAVSRAAASVGVWPATVIVRREEVAGVLEPLLRERGCEVGIAPVLVDLDGMARDLAEHLAEREGWPTVCAPNTWAGWGLPGWLVKGLFRAYAGYHRAAPWRRIDDFPPILAEWDDGTGPWVASVMGAELGEFGLAVFSHPGDFQDLIDRDEDSVPYQALQGWVVHLGYFHRQELPPAMVKEISRAGWEVVGVGAYPSIMPILTPGGGLQRDRVRRLTQLLHGIGALVKRYGPRLESPEGGVFTWTEGGLVLSYAVAPEGGGPGEDLPLGLQEIIEDVRRAGLETEEELEAHLAFRMEQYNTTSREELGGISPQQAQTLIEEGLGGTGYLRFADDLSLEDVEGSAFLANARVFLSRLADTQGARATAAGNLKRVFVAEMLPGMCLREDYLEALNRGNRVLNEDDVWPLHILRVNLEIGRLVKLRKGTFSVTKRGRELAAPQAAGRLFGHLFRTYFGEFNLDYGGRGPDRPGLQPVVPLLLWQIGVRSREWISVADLADVVLPERPDEPGAMERSERWREVMDLEYKVLTSLVGFGLLEEQQTGHGKDWRRRQHDTQVRITPLYSRFLLFDWG